MKKYDRVLIVDDSKALRTFVKNTLKSNFTNIVVLEAENGKDAIKQFKNTLPKVTILDINMPEINGITTLRAIKKINPNSKVIIVSAYETNQSNLNKLKEAGASYFVPKPLNKILLIKLISDFLQRIPHAGTHNKVSRFISLSVT